MKEYKFPWLNEERGYKLFPQELENNPCVLFHGTVEQNLQKIINNGFKSFPPLTSVSYAKCSSYSLGHICQNQSTERSENGVVIAVRFESLNLQEIVENHSDIHVYDEEIQPEIIATCIIPKKYQHR